MEDHKMHKPEEDQNGNIISIQGEAIAENRFFKRI